MLKTTLILPDAVLPRGPPPHAGHHIPGDRRCWAVNIEVTRTCLTLQFPATQSSAAEMSLSLAKNTANPKGHVRLYDAGKRGCAARLGPLWQW